MSEHDWLAERFEQDRGHLRAVAYRMLGSAAEAEDAVQEAWIRTSRAGAGGVDNLGGWLTTIVARVCLDMLRSRKARREELLGAKPAEPPAPPSTGTDPEYEALLGDSVGLALLVVLEALTPAERVAFVLHDMFDVPFDEIAPILSRTPAAARKLASRARLRVRGADTGIDPDTERRRRLVAAFFAASRDGDFDALLSVLDPGAVVRADAAAVAMGAPAEVRGARAVAETFSGRAQVARVALVDGLPGAVFAPGGQVRVVFAFTIEDDRVTAIDLIADAEQIAGMDLAVVS
jgi:RNA polymerase sigma-70 factor (ECF subfamily)